MTFIDQSNLSLKPTKLVARENSKNVSCIFFKKKKLSVMILPPFILNHKMKLPGQENKTVPLLKGLN